MPISYGIWHWARNPAGAQELTEKQREATAKISALLFLKGYSTVPDVENVTIYDKEAARGYYEKPSLKKLLLFFIFSFLMLASFTYGIISVGRQHVPYKIYLSLYQQKFSPEWKRDGIWHKVRNNAGDQELTAEQREAIAKISALPYLKG